MQITKPHLNRSEVFSFAWTIARQELWSRCLPASRLRSLFPDALRRAWSELKHRAVIAAERAKQTMRPSSDIWADIQNLENRTILGHEGINRLANLQSAYHDACEREAEEKARAEMEAKRKMIAAEEYTEKRESVSSLSDKIAAARRAGDWDLAEALNEKRRIAEVDADEAQINGPRSVNFATISRIAVDGQVHEYRA